MLVGAVAESRRAVSQPEPPASYSIVPVDSPPSVPVPAFVMATLAGVASLRRNAVADTVSAETWMRGVARSVSDTRTVCDALSTSGCDVDTVTEHE